MSREFSPPNRRVAPEPGETLAEGPTVLPAQAPGVGGTRGAHGRTQRLSVYVHVPFCASRCAYCDFYSGESLAALGSFAALIEREIRLRRVLGPFAATVGTVYFGGGTPSLLPAPAIAQVLECLAATFGLEAAAELTLEANPVSHLDLEALAQAGLNRLSVGVQCLDDGWLRRLGRPHRAAEALHTLEAAVRHGFRSVSADLLCGLPGVAPERLGGWLSRVAEAGVDHISCYSLEIHPGTRLGTEAARGDFAEVDPTLEEEQWAAAVETLGGHGLRLYEVSNFARPGHESRHNRAYWEGTPYLGLGPGAHSYDPGVPPFGCRQWNAADLAAHEAAIGAGTLPSGGREELNRSSALLETLFLALRRADPIRPEVWRQRFALPTAALARALEQLQRQGLLRTDREGFPVPTPTALRRADGLALWLHDRLLAARAPRLQDAAR